MTTPVPFSKPRVVAEKVLVESYGTNRGVADARTGDFISSFANNVCRRRGASKLFICKEEDNLFFSLEGHGSAHGSAHGSVPTSPVEEVSPVKPKKPSRRAARANKDKPKEPPKDWTMAEDTALCQAWCDVSENNIDGNSMKSKGFWDAVIKYFEKETGSSRGYDSIVSK
ncbi:hypothetical protein Tco_1354520 [Tanacetum coccineum]